jgi:hypothetical protein
MALRCINRLLIRLIHTVKKRVLFACFWEVKRAVTERFSYASRIKIPFC